MVQFIQDNLSSTSPSTGCPEVNQTKQGKYPEISAKQAEVEKQIQQLRKCSYDTGFYSSQGGVISNTLAIMSTLLDACYRTLEKEPLPDDLQLQSLIQDLENVSSGKDIVSGQPPSRKALDYLLCRQDIVRAPLPKGPRNVSTNRSSAPPTKAYAYLSAVAGTLLALAGVILAVLFAVSRIPAMLPTALAIAGPVVALAVGLWLFCKAYPASDHRVVQVASQAENVKQEEGNINQQTFDIDPLMSNFDREAFKEEVFRLKDSVIALAREILQS